MGQRLKYHSISDAKLDLGQPEEIRDFFAGFQRSFISRRDNF